MEYVIVFARDGNVDTERLVADDDAQAEAIAQSDHDEVLAVVPDCEPIDVGCGGCA